MTTLTKYTEKILLSSAQEVCIWLLTATFPATLCFSCLKQCFIWSLLFRSWTQERFNWVILLFIWLQLRWLRPENPLPWWHHRSYVWYPDALGVVFQVSSRRNYWLVNGYLHNQPWLPPHLITQSGTKSAHIQGTREIISLWQDHTAEIILGGKCFCSHF